MSANLSFFERCLFCCQQSSSEDNVNDRIEDDQNGISEEELVDLEITKHRMRFLDYPYKFVIESPQDLLNSEDTRVLIHYMNNADVSIEGWNSAIQEVADIKRLTDLSLCMQETVGCRYVEPDFAVLLQCPLKSFAIEKYKRVGNTASSIPHGIITALGTLSELEALTIIRVNSSEGLINLLTNDRFPNLQYLNVHLNKKLDFGKLTKLTFLRVSGSAAKTNVDLSSLTELRALQVRGRDTVLKLNSGCRYLKWLLLSGVIEIDGDVPAATHCLLSGSGTKFDVVRKFPNLKQLSLHHVKFDSAIVIPANVDQLFVSSAHFKEIVLPAEKVLDVISLDIVTLLTVPQTLRANHLRFFNTFNDDIKWTKQILSETVLGSPKSLVVEYDEVDLDMIPLLEFLLEKEDFRRNIQFLATNIPLQKPLPPMPELRQLCLRGFADVQHVREVRKPTRLAKLFIAGNDSPGFVNWEALRLSEISDSLLVPAGLWVPAPILGLPIEISRVVPSVDELLHAKLLWMDHFEQSPGGFDVYSDYEY